MTLDPDLFPVLFECSLHATKDELSGIGVLEGELFPCGIRGSVVVPAKATVRCKSGPSLVNEQMSLPSFEDGPREWTYKSELPLTTFHSSSVKSGRRSPSSSLSVLFRCPWTADMMANPLGNTTVSPSTSHSTP